MRAEAAPLSSAHVHVQRGGAPVWLYPYLALCWQILHLIITCTTISKTIVHLLTVDKRRSDSVYTTNGGGQLYHGDGLC